MSAGFWKGVSQKRAFQGVKWELQGFLRFISEIPECHFCTLDQPKHLGWPRFKGSRISRLLLMWGTGCMKWKAAIFGDCIRTIVCLLAITIHTPSICEMYVLSFQHSHSLIPLRHQFEVQFLENSSPWPEDFYWDLYFSLQLWVIV